MGIGTAAQAVYKINKEDNRYHKYILIQLDESINVKSDAYKFMAKLGIKNPKVSDTMLHRINTFLKLNNINDSYDLEIHKYE
ncbi:hypothetical protein [Mycoplasmopsis felifaucium]|uniref:hypothetical protein n=1 Tax=Mycoplasmopsis felifaucium TaxID=35768 RepID=UPI0005690D3C|nr:hypothetical protein [Mycoplasmopsis felifaucium]